MSIFADRLKELRGSESQASFAEQLGLNRVQYFKYESGTNAPSIDVLANICRVHPCSADWLLGLTNKRCRSGNVSSPELLPRSNNSDQTDWQARALAAEAKLVTFRHLAEDVLKAL